MANVTDLPCDGDGVCMVCKQKAADGEILTCKTCVTPWHATCLTTPLKTLADASTWECPDCSDTTSAVVKPVTGCGGGGLVEKIRAIENDDSMTDKEKAKRRQQLLSGGVTEAPEAAKEEEKNKKNNGGLLQILGDKFNCSICMNLLERPVSTPCGHNFCLKCFQKMVRPNGRSACAFCRKSIPPKMAREPRINSAIVMAIRMAKLSQPESIRGPPKVSQFIHNQDRPDKAFTTERAKKTGKANACSGKIFVTVPLDHFGPILPESDPGRNQGVLVGETWDDRMECRQWGAHFPHVAGICGQGDHGAQSVALSGGYVDDEDHGEWFLYTGSGGRDLSGNKRTNKHQSSDQTFYKFNEALRVSCRQGYPVRVVRSHKEKRSSYAPQKGVRYDGIYRIEKCWRKKGIQGFKVCRYLFVRCDNEPAPWTSETIGDRPRPIPRVEELKQATDVTVRTASPSWDYDEEQGSWVWKKPAPESRKSPVDYEYDEEGNLVKKKKQRKQSKGTKTVKQKLLKEFSCLICQKVMVQPLTTPCAHNFCKACLEGVFAGQSFLNERTCGGRRALRVQKNVMKCPTCKNDIADFIQNPQVNRELMNVIESLQNQMKEESIGADTNGQNAESGDATEEVSNGEEIVLESIGTEETVDIDVENKENCEEKVETLKEEGTVEKDNLKPSRAITPQRVSMRNKAKDSVATSPMKSPVKSDAKSCDEVNEAVKPKRNYKRKKDSEDTCVPTADAKSCEEDLAAVKPKRAYNKRKKDGEDASVPAAADAGKKRRTRNS